MRIDQRILLEENELKPNRFVANAMLCVMAAALCVEVLNETHIFTVAQNSMRFCMQVLLLCGLSVQVLGRALPYAARRRSKYWILGLVQLATLLIVTALGQWAELFMFLPILLALQYHDRAVTCWCYVGAILAAVLSAPLSCLLHLPQADYYAFLLRSTGVLVGDLAPDPAYDLADALVSVFRFQSVSRCLLVAAVGAVAFSITRQGASNVNRCAASLLRSRTDALTGLQNRLSFEETMDVLRQEHPPRLICVYADADGLHRLNDTAGHAAGDAFIKECAVRLRNAYGEAAFRIGGDEFVAFTTDLTLAAAQEKRRHIEHGLQKKNLHLSIGLCALDQDQTIDQLLAAAEAEMYAAKNDYYVSVGCERRLY